MTPAALANDAGALVLSAAGLAEKEACARALVDAVRDVELKS